MIEGGRKETKAVCQASPRWRRRSIQPNTFFQWLKLDAVKVENAQPIHFDVCKDQRFFLCWFTYFLKIVAKQTVGRLLPWAWQDNQASKWKHKFQVHTLYAHGIVGRAAGPCWTGSSTTQPFLGRFWTMQPRIFHAGDGPWVRLFVPSLRFSATRTDSLCSKEHWGKSRWEDVMLRNLKLHGENDMTLTCMRSKSCCAGRQRAYLCGGSGLSTYNKTHTVEATVLLSLQSLVFLLPPLPPPLTTTTYLWRRRSPLDHEEFNRFTADRPHLCNDVCLWLGARVSTTFSFGGIAVHR